MPPSLRGVEILGGGLAGLSLGLGLRSRGVPVTIREAGAYPRHRVCGEFITGLTPHTLGQLGLDGMLDESLTADTVAWFDRRGIVLVRRLPEPARCLSRHRLDGRLAERFEELGGNLRTRDRTVPAPAEGRVLACGHHPRSRSRLVGLKQHFRGLDLTADLEMHLGRGAYVGLTRVESGAVNVCGLFRHEQGPCRLPDKIADSGLPDLARRLEAAVPVEGSHCAVAGLDYRPPRRVDKALSLGDRGGLIPPFTGNGMTIALQSAAAALPSLLEWATGRQSWAEAVSGARAARSACVRRKSALARILHPFLMHDAGHFAVRQLAHGGLLPFDTLFRLVH